MKALTNTDASFMALAMIVRQKLEELKTPPPELIEPCLRLEVAARDIKLRISAKLMGVNIEELKK